MGKIIVQGYINLPEASLDELLPLLKEHEQLTRQESGCLEFDVKQNDSRPTLFEVYEIFKNQAAFEHHQARAKSSEWGRATSDIERHYTLSRFLDGQCLCGSVQFEVADKFHDFHLCHCHQCQQASGSAYTSHLFIQKHFLTWKKGRHRVSIHKVPGRAIINAFCEQCGSPMPYESPAAKSYVIPAGSLQEEPKKQPQDHVFFKERAKWYDQVDDLLTFSGFPE